MIFVLLSACSHDMNSEIICTEAPTYDDWTQGFMSSNCQSCHATTALNRYNAPVSIYFDTYDDVVRQRDIIYSSVIEQGSMPPGGGVQEEDIILLQRWLACPK